MSNMATDERNFRSAYYEKVGFRSVEEKKSLEILLKEKPLDIQKLRQFCLRFTVPGIYRNLVWKILLGVIPIYVDSHKFVMQQRQQEYKDLEQALRVMRIIDANTTKSEVFYAMWCLESSKLNYDFNIHQMNGFTAITNTLQQMFDNNVDIYWLTKGFYKIVLQFKSEMVGNIDKTLNRLDKEDSELLKHLQDIDAVKIIPFNIWFESCFAGVINATVLAKIWDKLCGGSSKILIGVAFNLLTTLRRNLLRCTDTETVFQCICNITEESAEVIVNKALAESEATLISKAKT